MEKTYSLFVNGIREAGPGLSTEQAALALAKARGDRKFGIGNCSVHLYATTSRFEIWIRNLAEGWQERLDWNDNRQDLCRFFITSFSDYMIRIHDDVSASHDLAEGLLFESEETRDAWRG